MKSLGSALRQHSASERQRIAAIWGVAPLTGDTLDETLRLERQMRDAIAARSVWDALNPEERAVLMALLGPAARNWCLVEQLPERAALSPPAAQHAAESLQARLIVSEELARVQGNLLADQRPAFHNYLNTRPPHVPTEEKPILYVPTEIATTLYTVGRELLPLAPDRTTLTLDELLMHHRQGDLDQIGRRFGLVLQTYCSRNEAREAIAANVCQAEAVRYALKQIGPPLDDLYEWLIARGGRARLHELLRHMAWDLPTALNALRTFEDYAIAFDAFSDGERVVFIPAKTFDNLRRARSRPHTDLGLVARAAPPSIRPPDSPMLWDLAALIAAVAHQEVELTRAGAIPKRIVNRLQDVITNDLARLDDDMLHGYVSRLLAEGLDLGLLKIVEIEGHARLEFGAQLDAWARQDIRQQTQRLLRRWSQSRSWRDYAGAHYAGWYSIYLNLAVAREAMLSVLRRCEPGVWYDVNSLLAVIQGDDPFVLRPSQRFNGQGGFKMTDELRAHWDATDGELLRGILSSTLYDLGIVALGYDADAVPAVRAAANPDAILLTEVGAEVLRGDLGLAPTPTDRPLILQPNFEVLLLEPHMPALYQLLRFAQLEQPGRASRFRLTREALLRYLGRGATLESVVQFLERHSQKDLSQNVLYTLNDWSRQYKTARLSPVVLIELDDEAAAEALCASAKLRDLGLRRVGPTAVATPPGAAIRAVRKAIERAGFAAQADHAPAPTPSSVRG